MSWKREDGLALLGSELTLGVLIEGFLNEAIDIDDFDVAGSYQRFYDGPSFFDVQVIDVCTRKMLGILWPHLALVNIAQIDVSARLMRLMGTHSAAASLG